MWLGVERGDRRDGERGATFSTEYQRAAFFKGEKFSKKLFLLESEQRSALPTRRAFAPLV
jgi:hypothetical protein